MFDTVKIKTINLFKEPLSYIVIIFISSRLVLYHMGVRFLGKSLTYFCQFIDIYLLKNDLIQSIYYLHSQPPLYNLFLGVVLKLFPNNEMLVFRFIYLLLGLVLHISIFLIMTRLKISKKLSFLLTVLFMLHPACIMYENWLFYTYVVATFLCISGLFLHKFLDSGKWLDGFIFFTLLSFIVLIRSSFHLVWFILIASILLFHNRHDWKKTVCAFCIPLLLIVSLYAKNLYLFGIFTSSSWFGMNFSKTTTSELSLNERTLLVKEGKLSKLALIPPFSRPEKYKEYFPNIGKTNVPVLDQEERTTNIPVLDRQKRPIKSINWNNILYISVSKQYLNDSIYVLLHHPEVHLRALVKSFTYYFQPPSHYCHIWDNMTHLYYLERFYNKLFLRKLKYKNVFLVSSIGIPFLLFYGIYFIRMLRKESRDISIAITLAFICMTGIYVMLVSNQFDIRENYRSRFMVEPFFLIILGLFLNNIFEKLNGVLTAFREKWVV